MTNKIIANEINKQELVMIYQSVRIHSDSKLQEMLENLSQVITKIVENNPKIDSVTLFPELSLFSNLKNISELNKNLIIIGPFSISQKRIIKKELDRFGQLKIQFTVNLREIKLVKEKFFNKKTHNYQTFNSILEQMEYSYSVSFHEKIKEILHIILITNVKPAIKKIEDSTKKEEVTQASKFAKEITKYNKKVKW